MGGKGRILSDGTQPGSKAVNGLQCSTGCTRYRYLLNSMHILAVQSVQKRLTQQNSSAELEISNAVSAKDRVQLSAMC